VAGAASGTGVDLMLILVDPVMIKRWSFWQERDNSGVKQERCSDDNSEE